MTALLREALAGSSLQPVRGSSAPMVMQTLSLRRDPKGVLARLLSDYGDVAMINAYGIKIVVAQGLDAANAILVNRDRAFANEPGWSYFLGPFFRRGIMLMDFDEHHEHRRIMQQAFGRQQLEGYLAAMGPAIKKRMRTWQPAPHWRFRDHIKELTLGLALDVFLGLELTHAESDRINRAFIAAVAAGPSMIRLPLPGLRWNDGLRGRRVLEDFFYSHIGAKRRAGGDDLFAQLCHAQDESGARFTDEDVVNHMIFVLMAAHDTSTITMTSMGYFLAKHPEWQERAREEARLVAAPTTLADLDAMPIIDRCMKEALRLVPPVPVLVRKTVKDAVLQGHHVPKDTFVYVPINANHHHPAVWTDPYRFDPDRFSDSRREDKVHKLAWHPFGGGVHKCIGLYFGGMQIKTVFRELLRTFEWSVPDAYRWPLDEISLPVPRDGLPVRLTMRDSYV